MPCVAADSNTVTVISVDGGDTQNKHKGSEFVNHHLYYPQLSVTRRSELCLRAKISIWNFIAEVILTHTTDRRLLDICIQVHTQHYSVPK
jgi:hypothetical protein